MSAAGQRLLDSGVIAMLATVSLDGRPRMHPFVPKIVEGRLIAFIVNLSWKYTDLRDRGWYAIHALPGPQDEEFYIAGHAEPAEEDLAFRTRAHEAMGFVHEDKGFEALFEFRLDRALHTTWLDFGTPAHRPQFDRWQA